MTARDDQAPLPAGSLAAHVEAEHTSEDKALACCFEAGVLAGRNQAREEPEWHATGSGLPPAHLGAFLGHDPNEEPEEEAHD